MVASWILVESWILHLLVSRVVRVRVRRRGRPHALGISQTRMVVLVMLGSVVVVMLLVLLLLVVVGMRLLLAVYVVLEIWFGDARLLQLQLLHLLAVAERLVALDQHRVLAAVIVGRRHGELCQPLPLAAGAESCWNVTTGHSFSHLTANLSGGLF